MTPSEPTDEGDEKVTAATVDVKENVEANVMPTKEKEAMRLVKRGLLWSMGLGIIPVPIIDVVTITAAQLKMVKNLSDHYGVEFSGNIGKSILASLLGGVGGTGVAYGAAGTFLKAIPVVGTIAGGLSVVVMAGATTYAIGKVFIMHYEAGGTLLDFDPEKMKDYFAEQCAEGKTVAEKQKKEASKETPKEAPKKDAGKK